MSRYGRYNSQSQASEASRDVRVAFRETHELTQEELEQDDDDEEDDDFDFNPNTLSSKPPRKRNVDMLIISSGKTVKVKCRLPWTFKWLQATIRLKFPLTKRYNIENQLISGQFQVLEYHLDPASGNSGRAAINLLLSDICENNLGDGSKQRDEDRGAGGNMQAERSVFADFLRNQPDNQCSLGKILKNNESFLTVLFSESSQPV